MTMGNYADWMYVLCRTGTEESRHRGITMLLVDAHQPGVDVRPIRNIAGGLEFCEVFFDDVRTPADLVVGEVNGGWNVAMDTLGMERTGAMSPYMAHVRGRDDPAAGRGQATPVRRVAGAAPATRAGVVRSAGAAVHEPAAAGGRAARRRRRCGRRHPEDLLVALAPIVRGADARGVRLRRARHGRRRRTQLVPAHVPQLARRDDLRRRRRDPAQHRRRARPRSPPRTALTHNVRTTRPRLHVLAAHAPQTTVRALEPPVVVARLPQERLADAGMRQHEEVRRSGARRSSCRRRARARPRRRAATRSCSRVTASDAASSASSSRPSMPCSPRWGTDTSRAPRGARSSTRSIPRTRARRAS